MFSLDLISLQGRVAGYYNLLEEEGKSLLWRALLGWVGYIQDANWTKQMVRVISGRVPVRITRLSFPSAFSSFLHSIAPPLLMPSVTE